MDKWDDEDYELMESGEDRPEPKGKVIEGKVITQDMLVALADEDIDGDTDDEGFNIAKSPQPPKPPPIHVRRDGEADGLAIALVVAIVVVIIYAISRYHGL